MVLVSTVHMNVNRCTITGDVFEYGNSELRVFKCPYGVFLFSETYGDETGVEELGHPEGRIMPYNIRFLEDEECVREDVSIDAFCTDEKLMFPVGGVENLGSGTVMVVNGEYAISVIGQAVTDPSVVGREESIRLVRVSVVEFEAWRTPTRNSGVWVQEDVMNELLEEDEVVEVSVV